MTWRQWLNYLHRQLYVLDTYTDRHNRQTNHTMMVLHSLLSWLLVLPSLSGAAAAGGGGSALWGAGIGHERTYLPRCTGADVCAWAVLHLLCKPQPCRQVHSCRLCRGGQVLPADGRTQQRATDTQPPPAQNPFWWP